MIERKLCSKEQVSGKDSEDIYSFRFFLPLIVYNIPCPLLCFMHSSSQTNLSIKPLRLRRRIASNSSLLFFRKNWQVNSCRRFFIPHSLCYAIKTKSECLVPFNLFDSYINSSVVDTDMTRKYLFMFFSCLSFNHFNVHRVSSLIQSLKRILIVKGFHLAFCLLFSSTLFIIRTTCWQECRKLIILNNESQTEAILKLENECNTSSKNSGLSVCNEETTRRRRSELEVLLPEYFVQTLLLVSLIFFYQRCH